MKTKGYVKLDRDLLEHWIWTGEPFTKGQAWVDLLMLANHKTTKSVQNGIVFGHCIGCVDRSLLWLSDRWGWSRGKAKRFLELLQKEGMVSVTSTTHGTTIKIENYIKRQQSIQIFREMSAGNSNEHGYPQGDGTTDGTT